MVPLSCPICGRPKVQEILVNIPVYARPQDFRQAEIAVNALAAFMCSDRGHVFFVRVSDLSDQSLFAAG